MLKKLKVENLQNPFVLEKCLPCWNNRQLAIIYDCVVVVVVVHTYNSYEDDDENCQRSSFSATLFFFI